LLNYFLCVEGPIRQEEEEKEEVEEEEKKTFKFNQFSLQ
jgi:hypothetical protein